ncbi:bifunctional riboflavin kinase/FAD synthetase [Blattabacterium cuenoti]|uniref:bifunctional riboflavin kinase/FAD synthetase n=1 Tax=Blattabacterium cuenoti TaxID=1653831 RepID=UPI00163B8D1E|nr:bifunctional riboflavin kinase/FAD synthetase [Blattabacterium cuenoti]
MKIYSFIDEFYSTYPCIFTIGIFDGVHIGHKKLIQHLIFKSNKKYSSVLLTFNPHPKEILNPNKNFFYLNTLSERINNIKKIGLEHLIIHPFTRKFSNLTITDFFKKISNSRFCFKKILLGYDFNIGKNNNNSFKILKELSNNIGLKLYKLNPYKIDNEIISSTKIRESITLGNLEWANKALGYYYTLFGYVTIGKKIGRTLNFPTANLIINKKKLIPKNGVYAVKVIYENSIYKGMMNIGTNPTVDINNHKIKIEVNIFNFNKNIYNKKIKILIIKMIRKELKFLSINELKKQIIKDKSLIKHLFIKKTFL